MPRGVMECEEKLYCQVKRGTYFVSHLCAWNSPILFICMCVVCLPVCLSVHMCICLLFIYLSVRSQLSVRRPCSLMTPPSSLGWRRTKTMSSTATVTIWERLGQWGTPEVRWSKSGGGGGKKGSGQREVWRKRTM